MTTGSMLIGCRISLRYLSRPAFAIYWTWTIQRSRAHSTAAAEISRDESSVCFDQRKSTSSGQFVESHRTPSKRLKPVDIHNRRPLDLHQGEEASNRFNAMANQQNLNKLLQWSVQNSSPNGINGVNGAQSTPTTSTTTPSQLDPNLLAQLTGGPSDADLMVQSMETIRRHRTSSDDNTEASVAWENLHLLLEQIDNAHNLTALKLWPPLLDELDSPSPHARLMAAWCVATAVQNNRSSQEALLAHGGVKKLVERVMHDGEEALVRRKAVAALSSEVRNFEDGLCELERWLPVEVRGERAVDASVMEEVDGLMGRLREYAASR